MGYDRVVFRAILFDFNGVLIDDEAIHFELLQQVFGEEGFPLQRESHFHRCVGRPDRAIIAEFYAELGQSLSLDRLSRLVARKAAYYQDRVRRDGYPVVPGAVPLVESARAEGLMLGVVSGSLRDEIEDALDQIGVRDAFKIIVPADDVERGKPDPQGYLMGLRALNVEPPLPARLLHPHEVLAIEDSPVGLAAAAGAGLQTLGLEHDYAQGRLDQADRRVKSLVGLGPAELERLFGP